MSKIRWVDFLNSESANTYETKDSVSKKTNTQNEQGSILNKNLLDSFNTADLDNSNVGINLQIKNMSIIDKNEKTQNEEANRHLKKSKEEKQKNASEENGCALLHEESEVCQKDSIMINERKEEGAMLVQKKIQETKRNEDTNNKQETNEKETSVKEEDSKQESSKEQKKVNKQIEGKNKQTPNEIKSRNSSLRRSNRNKKENLKDANDKNKKNVETKNTTIKENEKNIHTDLKTTEKKVLKFNLENIKKTQKGKKRKERYNGTTDNSISKFDYTESCDITMDENNIPLNPTKKLKKKTRDSEDKESNKNSNQNIKDNIMENNKETSSRVLEKTQNKKSATYTFMMNEVNTKEKKKIQDFMDKLTMPNYKFIQEENPSLNQKNERNEMNKVSSTHNIANGKNTSRSQFEKFNEHFDNYMGDIMNNYELSMNNVNSNRVSRRLKEIAVGKSTKEYKNYVKAVKYDERMEDDPKTPNAYENITNATFQAKYNLWRKKLHKFDEI